MPNTFKSMEIVLYYLFILMCSEIKYINTDNSMETVLYYLFMLMCNEIKFINTDNNDYKQILKLNHLNASVTSQMLLLFEAQGVALESQCC